MEKKKNNKKFFIIGGIVVVVVVIIALVVIMNLQKQQGNQQISSKTNNKSNNDIVNRESHTYGNTNEHNSNQGRIATDDEYWYFAGTEGIKKQAKKDIREFNTTQKIFSSSSLYLNLYQDYIYFLNMDNNTIYRINKDGNNRQEIANNILSFYIVDDFIYYNKAKGDKYGSVYRNNLNGDNEELILDYSVSRFYIYGKSIYYIAGHNVLNVSDLNGNNEKYLLKDVEDFKIYNDNNLFYEDTIDNNTVYTLHSDYTTDRIDGTGNGGYEINLDSIIFNKDYTLYLPPDGTSFKYYSTKNNYLWMFIDKKNDEKHYYIAGGNETGDFEVIDNVMCIVSSSGGCSYLNTQGSDFMNEEKLQELMN